jgi:SAM-dependent methyltransferase
MELNAVYKSADVDTRHSHDFADFLTVDEPFDAILMLELLEHLSLAEGLRFVSHAIELLTPGGVLAVSTPNPRHAHQVWSADFTHVRPWPAHDLWALCETAGLEGIEVYRQYLITRKRWATLPLQLALSKLLQLDPAYGLLVFAHKPR